MKIAMHLPEDHQYSVMQRILDGTLSIDSIKEFKEILNIYPDDPVLRRKYADLLVTKSKLEQAVGAFERAAELFIGQGMNLQAIVAKILQWSIEKPTHDQGRSFHQLLRNEGAQHTPLQRFWASMDYAELVAIMLRLVRVKLQTGEKITCVDDPADEIYFVVSGTLAETWSPDCQAEASRAGIETEPILLGSNDIFGNIFPLEEPTVSYTDIVAVSDVELVKIAKPVLRMACQTYPHIEQLLREIHKPDNVDRCDRAWQTVRRTIRYGLPTKVEISSPQSKLNGSSDWMHTGIAVDISLGGLCIDLGPRAVGQVELAKGMIVDLSLDLLNQVAVLDLSGKIVWHRHQNTETGPTTLIGIRFDPLNSTDRGLLAEYCEGSVGEQNLLWSLWDSLVKTDE
jgi:hypothetical protein